MSFANLARHAKKGSQLGRKRHVLVQNIESLHDPGGRAGIFFLSCPERADPSHTGKGSADLGRVLRDDLDADTAGNGRCKAAGRAEPSRGERHRAACQVR